MVWFDWENVCCNCTRVGQLTIVFVSIPQFDMLHTIFDSGMRIKYWLMSMSGSSRREKKIQLCFKNNKSYQIQYFGWLFKLQPTNSKFLCLWCPCPVQYSFRSAAPQQNKGVWLVTGCRFIPTIASESDVELVHGRNNLHWKKNYIQIKENHCFNYSLSLGGPMFHFGKVY